MIRRRFSRRNNTRYGMSQKHLSFIRQLPSLVSGGRPCEAHHLMVREERGVGRKARDMWAVPLTWDEHRQLHMRGSKFHDEWFLERGIKDPYFVAGMLWVYTGDLDAMLAIIEDSRP